MYKRFLYKRKLQFNSIEFVFIVEGSIVQNIKHKLTMIINKVQLISRKKLRKDHSIPHQINRRGRRVRSLFFRVCIFFFLVAYLSSYHEKAINALYELA